MEALENLSKDIDTYLPKLNKNEIISVLTQLFINTERKPDAICLLQIIRCIQKGYEDVIGDEERDLEGKV